MGESDDGLESFRGEIVRVSLPSFGVASAVGVAT